MLDSRCLRKLSATREARNATQKARTLEPSPGHTLLVEQLSAINSHASIALRKLKSSTISEINAAEEREFHVNP